MLCNRPRSVLASPKPLPGLRFSCLRCSELGLRVALQRRKTGVLQREKLACHCMLAGRPSVILLPARLPASKQCHTDTRSAQHFSLPLLAAAPTKPACSEATWSRPAQDSSSALRTLLSPFAQDPAVAFRRCSGRLRHRTLYPPAYYNCTYVYKTSCPRNRRIWAGHFYWPLLALRAGDIPRLARASGSNGVRRALPIANGGRGAASGPERGPPRERGSGPRARPAGARSNRDFAHSRAGRRR